MCVYVCIIQAICRLTVSVTAPLMWFRVAQSKNTQVLCDFDG